MSRVNAGHSKNTSQHTSTDITRVAAEVLDSTRAYLPDKNCRWKKIFAWKKIPWRYSMVLSGIFHRHLSLYVSLASSNRFNSKLAITVNPSLCWVYGRVTEMLRVFKMLNFQQEMLMVRKCIAQNIFNSEMDILDIVVMIWRLTPIWDFLNLEKSDKLPWLTTKCGNTRY